MDLRQFLQAPPKPNLEAVRAKISASYNDAKQQKVARKIGHVEFEPLSPVKNTQSELRLTTSSQSQQGDSSIQGPTIAPASTKKNLPPDFNQFRPQLHDLPLEYQRVRPVVHDTQQVNVTTPLSAAQSIESIAVNTKQSKKSKRRARLREKKVRFALGVDEVADDKHKKRQSMLRARADEKRAQLGLPSLPRSEASDIETTSSDDEKPIRAIKSKEQIQKAALWAFAEELQAKSDNNVFSYDSPCSSDDEPQQARDQEDDIARHLERQTKLKALAEEKRIQLAAEKLLVHAGRLDPKDDAVVRRRAKEAERIQMEWKKLEDARAKLEKENARFTQEKNTRQLAEFQRLDKTRKNIIQRVTKLRLIREEKENKKKEREAKKKSRLKGLPRNGHELSKQSGGDSHRPSEHNSKNNISTKVSGRIRQAENKPRKLCDGDAESSNDDGIDLAHEESPLSKSQSITATNGDEAILAVVKPLEIALKARKSPQHEIASANSEAPAKNVPEPPEEDHKLSSPEKVINPMVDATRSAAAEIESATTTLKPRPINESPQMNVNVSSEELTKNSDPIPHRTAPHSPCDKTEKPIDLLRIIQENNMKFGKLAQEILAGKIDHRVNPLCEEKPALFKSVSPSTTSMSGPPKKATELTALKRMQENVLSDLEPKYDTDQSTYLQSASSRQENSRGKKRKTSSSVVIESEKGNTKGGETQPTCSSEKAQTIGIQKKNSQDVVSCEKTTRKKYRFSDPEGGQTDKSTAAIAAAGRTMAAILEREKAQLAIERDVQLRHACVLETAKKSVRTRQQIGKIKRKRLSTQEDEWDAIAREAEEAILNNHTTTKTNVLSMPQAPQIDRVPSTLFHKDLQQNSLRSDLEGSTSSLPPGITSSSKKNLQAIATRVISLKNAIEQVDRDRAKLDEESWRLMNEYTQAILEHSMILSEQAKDVVISASQVPTPPTVKPASEPETLEPTEKHKKKPEVQSVALKRAQPKRRESRQTKEKKTNRKGKVSHQPKKANKGEVFAQRLLPPRAAKRHATRMIEIVDIIESSDDEESTSGSMGSSNDNEESSFECDTESLEEAEYEVPSVKVKTPATRRIDVLNSREWFTALLESGGRTSLPTSIGGPTNEPVII